MSSEALQRTSREVGEGGKLENRCQHIFETALKKLPKGRCSLQGIHRRATQVRQLKKSIQWRGGKKGQKSSARVAFPSSSKFQEKEYS